MKKTFLQILSEVAGAKESLEMKGKIIDPKTGEITKGSASTVMKAFKNENYRKLVEKMKTDPDWKKQYEIIRKNNVMFLNRLYGILKTKDPELDNLKVLFNKTKNDDEYFSYMNSFIIPLSSLTTTTAKIESEKIWDDENYKDALRKNAFTLTMPKGGVSPTADNVMITWKYTEGTSQKDGSMSIRDFNEKMQTIILNFQKYTDIVDAIEGTKSINKLFQQEEGQNNNTPLDERKIKKEIEREDFLNNLATFISFIKYPSDKGLVVGLKKIEENKDKFKDDAFQELLSGDNTNDITFIFANPNIYDDIIKIGESLKNIRTIYNSYSKEVKSVIDSSFLQTEKARAPFGVTINEIIDIIEKIKDFGIKFHELKMLIKDVKKKGEVPFTSDVKRVLSINAKDLGIVLDRLANSIIRLQSIKRICGFIDLYRGSQFHNLINIDELDLNDDAINDYYVMASIVPEDLAVQSTYQFWTSCQNLIGGYTGLNQWVGSGTLVGNIVVFLLALDWSKPTGGNTMKTVKTIKHSAITDPEDIMSINDFKEKAQSGIQGTKKLEVRKFLRSYAIRPVGRVLIKTFELNETGARTHTPEIELQGGSEEEIDTLKFVDRLYTPHSDITMRTSKGEAYGQAYNKYATIFYRSMKSIIGRVNYPSKPGMYGQRQLTYADSPTTMSFGKLQKDISLGKKVNFARQTTKDLLDVLKQDKNLLRYVTFRHALFSKDVIDGTLDLQGTKIESLDPMHPTNRPDGIGLPDDKYEDIEAMKGAWKVNDNFRKDSGDFNAPLTKAELELYK